MPPRGTLDDTHFNELYGLLKEAMVIKLFGKTVGYHVLKDKLRKLWKLTWGFDIMDIDQSFYLVKSDLQSD